MKVGVLLMAYGSPGSPEEVEPYLKDIRGRDPSADAVRDLTERYERVGWSPLLDITNRQAEALEKELSQNDDTVYSSYVGMKHWHPYISATVQQMVKDDVDEIVGLVLAPHYSKMSVGGYRARIEEALGGLASDMRLRMINQWYDEPAFVKFWAANINQTLGDWRAGKVRIFFTAHSLPEKILEEGDPYLKQLRDSSRLIAEAAGVDDWEFAFQSASHTGIPWLGPDILDRLTSFSNEGGRRAIIAPIGFVSDHLEILFDVEVEGADRAREVGIELRRVASPNDVPAFIEALANVVLTRNSHEGILWA